MKSFKKLPLLALLCLTTVGAAFSESAIAGQTTTNGADAESNSSIGVVFVPSQTVGAIMRVIRSSPELAAAIKSEIGNAINSIRGGGTISRPGGIVVTLPASIADLIVKLIEGTERLADSGNFDQTVAAKNFSLLKQESNAELQQLLERQIADELAEFDVELDVSTLVKSLTGLGDSPERLPVATDAMNDLINSASRTELEAIARSPSLGAISQVLVAGNAAL